VRPFHWLGFALAGSILVSGCLASNAPQPRLACPAGVCTLVIQNDAATTLAVRFADSTGQLGLLGLVSPRTMRVFRIQWAKTSGLRLYVMTRQDELFNADISLHSSTATQVHFPSDFKRAEAGVELPGLAKPIVPTPPQANAR
jgi:hypothetical protein